MLLGLLLLCLGRGATAQDPLARMADRDVTYVPVARDARENVAVLPHWKISVGDPADLSFPEIDGRPWTPSTLGASRLPGVTLRPFEPVWYRAHLRVPSGSRHLGMVLFAIEAGERIFVNGHQVDSLGRLRPGEGAALLFERFIILPQEDMEAGEITLAIRTDTGPLAMLPITDRTQIYLGPVDSLLDFQALLAFRNFTSNSVTIVIEMLVLLLAVALAVAVRAQSEYVSLVLLVGTFLVTDVVTTSALVSGILMTPGLQLLLDLGGLSTILLLDLTRAILHLHRPRWLRTVYLVMACSVVPVWVLQTAALYGHPGSALLQSLAWWTETTVVFLPLAVLPLLCLWNGLSDRNGEALLLFLPLLFLGVLAITVPLDGLHLAPDLYQAQAPAATFFVKWSELARIFLCVTLLILLVLRTVRIARERGVVVSELHAAQTVQQTLLDSSDTATPGFRVETAYLPASDVGGDFYFFASAADRSLLLVVGDVSGKGLRAAMTVSAIVGALRALEHRDPQAVLLMLNRALVGHMEGFVTCCAVLIAADGTMRLANAGNPAPYLNGTELETEPGIPLGLSLDVIYDEVTMEIPVGGRLLFASDGVIEATRARSGELFGFERTAEFARKPVRLLATAAKAFGQIDDITVLAVERTELS